MAAQDTTADATLASDVADQSLKNNAAADKAAELMADGVDGTESEDGNDEEEVSQTVDGQSQADPSGKKKKKKKSKKKSKATAEPESAAPTTTSLPTRPVPASDIPALLKQLAQNEKAKGREGKDQSEYKFWNTQPVPKFKEPNLLQTIDGESLPEGAILEGAICKMTVTSEPEKLTAGYEWCLVDLTDPEEIHELYDLLFHHYVEDQDGGFRFRYSEKFLQWALKPPGWKKEWHIGIRAPPVDGNKGKLAAFIAGTPVTLKVRENTFNSVEINFLTIHSKIRNKRLAPVLIKEITRQCYMRDIFQALYTAGTVLPAPVSTCRYFHRSLDWEHLYKNDFSYLPPGSTVLRMKYKYKLETNTSIKGLRPMKKEDVPAVLDLLVRYMERYKLRHTWNAEDVEHWFCSEASKGVVFSYVVENEGKISDFMSYYLLESTVLKSTKPDQIIRAAYLYYYATESGFQVTFGNKKSAKQIQETLAARLQVLIHDLLILAKKEGFHVFNALTMMDNPLFLTEQKFEKGNGKLNYYLFNWRTRIMGGGIDERQEMDKSKMGGVGIVMV